jgi:hypothetical protein
MEKWSTIVSHVVVGLRGHRADGASLSWAPPGLFSFSHHKHVGK